MQNEHQQRRAFLQSLAAMSAAAMLADIQTVLRSGDPYALRPAQLPSVAANADPHEPATAPAVPPPVQPHMPPPIPQPAYAAPYPSPAAAAPDWSKYPGMNPNAGAARGVGAAAARSGAGASAQGARSGAPNAAGDRRGARAGPVSPTPSPTRPEQAGDWRPAKVFPVAAPSVISAIGSGPPGK